MTQFKIKPKQVERCADQLSQLSRDIGSISYTLNRINVYGYLKGSAAGAVATSLKRVSAKLDNQKRNASSTSHTLKSISALYVQADAKVAGQSSGSGNVDTKKNAGGKQTVTDPAAGKKKDDDRSVSWKNGILTGSGSLFGINTGGTLSGDFLGASWDNKFTTGVKYKDGKLDSISLIDAKISGEAHLAKGKAEGNIGLLKGNAEVTVGQVKAEGSAGATLYKNGKLAPQISIGAEASATAVNGKAGTSFGSDNNDVHVGADGSLLTAKASANAGIGKITYKDNNGDVRTGYGVSGEAKAEAYVAQGRVKGGFKIFGVNIEVGVTGKAGGAGASAGGHVSTGGVGGSASLGAGVGIGLDFNIDWSGFKWGW